MKKHLWFAILILFSASTCLAQRSWTVPKLHELSVRDAIGRGTTNLSSEEFTTLKQETRKIIEDCVKDPAPWDPKTTVGLFNELRAKRVLLTPDGKQGLVVQGFGSCMCGATGNCPIWIIGEDSHAELLLQSAGIQSFAFQQSQAFDHFDLILGTHDSAMKQDLQRFRFDGSSYRRTGCATIEWSDEMGNRLQPPRITAVPCS
jgi:hypothetical protein